MSDQQIDRLARAGTRRTVERGDILHRSGDASYDFFVVVSGAVAVVGQLSEEPATTVRVHGPRRFLGELDLFGDTPVIGTAVVVRAGGVLRLSVKQLRSVLVQDSQLRESVQRAFLVRRAIRLEFAADLRLIGRSSNPNTQRVRRWAHDRGLTTALIDVDAGQEDPEVLAELGIREHDLPVVIVTRSGATLRHPDNEALETAVVE